MNCTPEKIQALENQFYVIPFPYYSRVKFVAERATSRSGTGFEYVIRAGRKVQAFSYGVNKEMIAAGYSQADGVATPAHTNIDQAFTTLENDRVLIRGLALQPLPIGQHRAASDDEFRRLRLPDAQFLAALANCVSVQLELQGGRQLFRMGNIPMIPGAGGLVGASPDLVTTRPLNGALPADPFANNGWATRLNYFPMPQGITWLPAGKEQSSFSVLFTVEKDIELQTGSYEVPEGNVTAENAPAEVATGVQAYTFPTELVAELQVILIGMTDGARNRTF